VPPAALGEGSTNSAKGAHRFVADSLVTAKACGATGTMVLRADSAGVPRQSDHRHHPGSADQRPCPSPPARSVYIADGGPPTTNQVTIGLGTGMHAGGVSIHASDNSSGTVHVLLDLVAYLA